MTIKYDLDFGYSIIGKTLGEVWIDLIKVVLQKGETCFDETRERKALYNIRFKSLTQKIPDSLIHKYGNEENIKTMLKLTFEEKVMFDCDITPSFSPGKKSYHHRILEGKMIDFVVKRLSEIPESKKAVIVFPTYEDFENVLQDMNDDYLPCLVSMQFRLFGKKGKYTLNSNFYFRSMDVYQKGPGNIEAMAKLSEIVAEKLSSLLGLVKVGSLEGIVADGHIYKNTYEEVEKKIINPVGD